MSHTRLIFSILFPCFLCRLYAAGEEKIALVFYLSLRFLLPHFLSITEFSIYHLIFYWTEREASALSAHLYVDAKRSVPSPKPPTHSCRCTPN
ncbi:hypothetical protein FLL78_14635 [Vibrio cholerae]|nr:hypothetical protein FLL78_14635 [Vibrio cholerae]